MVYNEELDKEVPLGWRVGTLADIMDYSKDRVNVSKLELHNYISTEDARKSWWNYYCKFIAYHKNCM